jgi:cell wall-associated NlpC family hydrolase
VTDSADQARSQAWSLWTKLAAPALLRCPVLGISVVLVVSTPFAAAARTLPRSQESASAEPTQRQLHVLRSYERYEARLRAQSVKASRAVRFAYGQVGKPYRWGGAGPRSYDCSGLVMAAWRRGGLRLPHRADLQHRMIRRKVRLKDLRPGDLVFFSGDHHVGIYVGHRHFLHAPHTGARVQRGTLSGWRLRVFAGAARPGAPAYHAWPHWVRALAEHDSGHGIEKARHPHGDREPAATADLDTTRPDDAPPIGAPPSGAIPELGDGVDDQGPGVGPGTDQPPVPVPAPPPVAGLEPSAGPSGPSGTSGPDGHPPAPPPPTPVATAPVAKAPVAKAPVAKAPVAKAPVAKAPVAKAPVARPYAPPVAGKRVAPAPYGITQRPSAYGPDDLAFSLLTMSAHAPRGHHAVVADGTPVPPPVPPPGAQANPRPHRQWPRNSVQQRNDEQRIDRDYDDTGGADEDVDSGDGGIDLRSLLGDAPLSSANLPR